MAVKETTGAVARKNEKETVLNRTRTIECSIARSWSILNLSVVSTRVVSRAGST